jgi:hypothetical protein
LVGLSDEGPQFRGRSGLKLRSAELVLCGDFLPHRFELGIHRPMLTLVGALGDSGRFIENDAQARAFVSVRFFQRGDIARVLAQEPCKVVKECPLSMGR